MNFAFGDIVVVEDGLLGVVVKIWVDLKNNGQKLEIYVRNYNRILEYRQADVQRYLVRHKFLTKKEKEYQYNAMNNL